MTAILTLAWDVVKLIGYLTSAVVCGWFAFRLLRGDRLERRCTCPDPEMAARSGHISRCRRSAP